MKCFLLAAVSLLLVTSSSAYPYPTSIASTPNATWLPLEYVTLEEHWLSPALKNVTVSNPYLQLLVQGTFGTETAALLADMNTSRLQSMNENGVRMQVVSNNPAPGALTLPVAVTAANNELAAAIAPFPTRFRAFCYLAMAFPDEAATELTRCINELGFVGALVDGFLVNGTFYDGPEYEGFWSTLESLQVPIYIHPTFPNNSQLHAPGGRNTPVSADFSLFYAANMGTTSWDFHANVGLHFMRLYSAGVFERHPGLKLILGHMGEMVPFMLERSDYFLSPLNTSMKSLKQVYADNVWITTAGFYWTSTLATVLRNTKVERIMYSVDYPFGGNNEGAAFLQELRSSGMVNEQEFQAIAHGNAEALLKLPVPTSTTQMAPTTAGPTQWPRPTGPIQSANWGWW